MRKLRNESQFTACCRWKTKGSFGKISQYALLLINIAFTHNDEFQ